MARMLIGPLLAALLAGPVLAAAPGSTEITCDVDRTQFRALAQGQTHAVFRLWDSDVGGVQCGAHAVPTSDIVALYLKTDSFDGVPRKRFLELRTVLGDNAAPASICAGADTWLDVTVGTTTLGCDVSGRRRLHSVAYARNAVAGPPGPAGTACWDLDADGACDLSAPDEDVDNDGACTAADCKGPMGDSGAVSGTIVPFAGGGVPPGWLPCDGAAVSRTTFAVLFAVIGTTFGSGDGATTFNLPDLRGRTAVGRGIHADVSAVGLGDNVNLSLRRPLHSHLVNAHVHHVPDHVHSFRMNAGINNGNLLNIDPHSVGGYFVGVGTLNLANGAHIGFTPFPIEIYHQDTFATGNVDTDARSPGTDLKGPSYLVLSYIIKG